MPLASSSATPDARHALQKIHHATDGTSLSYTDLGPADAPAIVLCHGLAANGSQFAADGDHFAAAGYRVLIPDLRGHGRSGAPVTRRPDDFSIATMAADLLSMLDHAGVACTHWVGNSLGGILALHMLEAHAIRFRTLTLFGTCFALNLPAVAAPVFPLLYTVLGPRLLSTITAANTTRYKPARPLIAAMARTFDPRVGSAITRHIRHYDLLDNALAYPGPVHILVGGQDRAVNLALRPALKRIGPRPNWTITDLPEAGHCANLDATQSWREALQGFWRE